MLLNIEHQTQYVYDELVQYTIQTLRLTPQHGSGQRVRQWEIKVPGQLSAHQDAFGNLSHTLVIDQPHQALLIAVSGQIETGVTDHALPAYTSALPLSVFLRDTPLTRADSAMAGFAAAYADKPVTELMHGLREQMVYLKGATAVDTTAAEAFRLGKGVCQDHAHAFIGCCRHLGLPARYVSGYLFTADGNLMQSHAWVDVWQHDTWHSLDVSNGVVAGEAHVRLAVGLDYRSACPVSGMRRGGGTEGMASLVSVNQQALKLEQRQQHLQHLYQQAQAAQQ